MIASEIWATCCILLLIWGSKYDLYSKSKVKINQEEVKPYYLSLIKKVNLYFIYIDMLNYNFFIFSDSFSYSLCSTSQKSLSGERLKAASFYLHLAYITSGALCLGYKACICQVK